MPIVDRNPPNKRNLYIDACRGVAALGIISIHTAFYGGFDVPEWFRSLTLFLDVPFFFYISGWAYSYKDPDILRSGKGIISIWLKWIFFICVMDLVCLVLVRINSGYVPLTSPSKLLEAFMFKEGIAPGFFVIGGSVWFIKFFFASLIINTVVLKLVHSSKRKEEYEAAYLAFLIIAYLWVLTGGYFLGLDIIFVLFYATIWMMGYIGFGTTKSVKGFIVCLAAALAGLFITTYFDMHLLQIGPFDIQASKCTPSVRYLVISMFMILIARFFEKLIKNPNRVLVHIGQNAIFYFFGQGVGSSLINYYSSRLPIGSWFFKYLICFAVNIVITVMVAEIMRILYEQFSHLCRKASAKIKAS